MDLQGEPPWSTRGRIEEAVALRRSAIPALLAGDFARAAVPLQEAVTRLRAVAATDPEPAGPQLGRSLAASAGLLARENGFESVLPLALEARPLLERGAAADPRQFLYAQAFNLQILGECHRRLGQYDSAAQALVEAIELAERPECQPDPLTLAMLPEPELAQAVRPFLLQRCHAVLFLAYLKQGREPEALATAHVALDLARELAAHHPESCALVLAAQLSALGEIYAKRRESQIAVGYRQESIPHWQDAIRNARARLARDPAERKRVALVQALRGYALELGRLERTAEAADPAREAVQLARQLASRDPKKHQALFESSQRLLARLEQRPW